MTSGDDLQVEKAGNKIGSTYYQVCSPDNFLQK